MNIDNLSSQIIKSSFVVHNTLGTGFLEKVYQNSFAYEMSLLGMKVDIEKHIKVFYKGKEVGFYFADLVVNNSIILEIKCVKRIAYPHIMQLKN